MTARPSELRTSSIRVALATTAIIALAYLLIGSAVVAIVNQGLTTEIDRRLAASLESLTHEPPPSDHGYGPPRGGPRYGSTLVVWTVRSDGTVATSETGADLPDGYSEVSSPTTVTIGEDEFRIQGARTEFGSVVVGQTTAEVTRARTTLILAEIVIAPILLIIVFLGAVAIGRRVAAPIERARVRQLEFTADASHELRTPLSVIEAHTSLALAEDRDAAWYRNAFSKIEVENRRMRRLVEDLLWLARFDATKDSHVTDPVDLGVLAADTVDRFRVVAEARSLGLRLAVEPGDHSVAVPADWLDRLLGVLLDNAAKYAPAGSEVVVSVAADSGRIRLTVDDAGAGIPEAERTRIFDRFHRATDSSSGAGLGLAIADAIVRATGGRWRVGASPAGGASMSVAWRREPA
ncbi:MAG: HAMP domain-containing histidine kinase [Chloroflexota bacterium]|nr:HAMP domain-containing histidine kinase [Chloroflexota bacterium]